MTKTVVKMSHCNRSMFYDKNGNQLAAKRGYAFLVEGDDEKESGFHKLNCVLGQLRKNIYVNLEYELVYIRYNIGDKVRVHTEAFMDEENATFFKGYLFGSNKFNYND